MSNRTKAASTKLVLKQMKQLFEPPVLSSENLKAYNVFLERAVEEIKPRGIIEEMFTKVIVAKFWEEIRLGRHKVLIVERRHQAHQEIEKKRLQKELQRKSAIAERLAEEAEAEAREAKQGEPTAGAGDGGAGAGAAHAGAGAEHTGDTKQEDPVEQVAPATSQFDRMVELDRVIAGLVSDVDNILTEPADEIDHARALEAGLDTYAELDRLQGVAMGWAEDAIRQLDLWRQGLGAQSRRVPDEIVDGELSETEQGIPSITGPDSGDEK